MAEPIRKWARGKRQLLEELHARLPESFDAYHEPFLGGGALFFDLEPASGTVNDTNERLVNFYEQVRDRPAALIERCRAFADPESDPDSERAHADVRNYYYQQRTLFNRRPRGEEFDPLEEAALLLYLDRTGSTARTRAASSTCRSAATRTRTGCGRRRCGPRARCCRAFASSVATSSTSSTPPRRAIWSTSIRRTSR
jgi:DNA adenine methylase